MNPVVGLDVSKGESQVQAFLDKGKPYRKSFSVMHTLDGLDRLLEFLVEVTKVTNGKKPSDILESTGHYHHPVVQFLEDHNYLYIVVNPLVSHRSRSANLRKVKTDAADAYQLCELFYKEELAPHRRRGIQLLNLRNLTRQQETITSNASQTKLQLQSVLDQVFPEYRGVFGNLYSKVSLQMLEAFPTCETVLQASEAQLKDKIVLLCRSRSEKWAMDKAQKLREAALRNPFQNNLYESLILILKCLLISFFNTKSIYPC